jgi:DNA-binding NarL/FixJ family response regulator
MTPIQSRILIVDDNALMRDAMVSVVRQHSDFMICGVTGDGHDTLAVLQRKKPHIALVSLMLSNSSWLQLIHTICKDFPETRVLAYSLCELHRYYEERALLAGAMGYVARTSSADELLNTMREILQGRFHVSSELEARLLKRAQERHRGLVSDPLAALSNREFEVLSHLGNGFTPKAIGRKLRLSVKTIETYKDRIREKMGIQDGATLLQYAIAWERDGQPMMRDKSNAQTNLAHQERLVV